MRNDRSCRKQALENAMLSQSLSKRKVMCLKPRNYSLLLLLAMILTVSPPADAMPEQALVPGGIAIIGLDEFAPDARVTFDGRKTTIFKYDDTWYALAGIPLKAKTGTYAFEIVQKDGSTRVSRGLNLAIRWSRRGLPS